MIRPASVEQRSARGKRRERIQQYILAAVGVSGMLALSMVAPNVAGMFAKKVASLSQLQVRSRSAITRLSRKGLVRLVRIDGAISVEITPRGRALLALYEAKTLLARNQKWDGRYRLVAFDIPQCFKKRRDLLRTTVRNLGFLHLQHSLWIFPHDCEEVVALLKSELKLGKSVIYMVVDEIENDTWIRKHFKLPLRT
jgi:DNA-binding transcriptional regulator PaaX